MSIEQLEKIIREADTFHGPDFDTATVHLARLVKALAEVVQEKHDTDRAMQRTRDYWAARQ